VGWLKNDPNSDSIFRPHEVALVPRLANYHGGCCRYELEATIGTRQVACAAIAVIYPGTLYRLAAGIDDNA
jgi:hypothetical protein